MTDWMDTLILAGAMLGIDQEKVEKYIDYGVTDEYIEEPFCAKFGCDIEAFENIVASLLNFVPPLKSGLSDKHFQCFGIQHETFFGAIVSQPFKGLKKDD